jgi:hypothetical protein
VDVADGHDRKPATDNSLSLAQQRKLAQSVLLALEVGDMETLTTLLPLAAVLVRDEAELLWILRDLDPIGRSIVQRVIRKQYPLITVTTAQ